MRFNEIRYIFFLKKFLQSPDINIYIYILKRQGIDIMDENDNIIGQSCRAGFMAVSQVALSRILTSIPILVVPPVTLTILERYSSYYRHNVASLRLPAYLTLITGVMIVGLPAAVALFPQKSRARPSSLEPKFHQLSSSDGKPIEWIYYNKGL